MDQDAIGPMLDAAADILVNDGAERVTIDAVARHTGLHPDTIRGEFDDSADLVVRVLNREFGRMFRVIIDNMDRDPRGGLLSRIYRYTFAAVYERPVARALYLMDRNGLNSLMRSSHGFAYIPRLGVRAEFIERMQTIGMVRRDVNPAQISAVVSAVAAGVALMSPHSALDEVSSGLCSLLEEGVDADVDDTDPGKAAFIDYAMSLAANRRGE